VISTAEQLAQPTKNEQRVAFLIGLLLVIVTLAIYWPATTHGFMLLDDGLYVSENPHVTGGLSPAQVEWAFTSAYASNWHPLTWLSHMVDCSIFGLYPGGHHLTNIILHALNTLLLFLALKRLTKRVWPGAVVAALFGWHPLHVESVAWIAERKDVLSTLFLMLTLFAYAGYVDKPSTRRYVWTLVFFALGLMCKPMLVTLPFVLLLLDYWPLGRVEGTAAGRDCTAEPKSWAKLIKEKIPFFALTIAACVITVMAQSAGGAVMSVAEVPVGLRVLNALNAYTHYLGQTVWPVNLSVYYLLPAQAALAPGICAALALAGISWLAFRWRARFPWLPVGWFWFAGTLVPVIGLVQVGSQAMADRYTYVPLIGLFITAVWSVEAALGKEPAGRAIGGALAAMVLLGCLALTHRQLAFWRDNGTLFAHATEVTPGNYFAEYELGSAFANAGKTAEAIAHHTESLRLNPNYEPSHYLLGNELAAAGRLDEAAFHFSEALKRDPTSQELHNNLGVVLAQLGKPDAAIAQFQQALQINPKYPKPYLNYAGVLEQLGQTGAALTNYQKARALEPASPEPLDKLARLLATTTNAQFRDPAAAVKLAENANQITQRQVPAYLATLAAAYAAAGNYSNAIAAAESAQTGARAQQLSELAQKLEHDLEFYRRGELPPVNSGGK
jgi:tetratricopeptide (TPR) repeat protein